MLSHECNLNIVRVNVTCDMFAWAIWPFGLCFIPIDRSYFDFSLLRTWEYSNVADEFDVLLALIYAWLAKK